MNFLICKSVKLMQSFRCSKNYLQKNATEISEKF
jgi:hypothetical protein